MERSVKGFHLDPVDNVVTVIQTVQPGDRVFWEDPGTAGEIWAVTAYTMVSTDGGIRMPSVPDAQIVPMQLDVSELDSVRAFGQRFSEEVGEVDILTAEGLHGRLDPAGWAALRTTLEDGAPARRRTGAAADSGRARAERRAGILGAAPDRSGLGGRPPGDLDPG